MGAATEVGSWQLQHLVLTQNRLVKGWPTWADERRGDAAPKPQAPSLMGVASVRGGDLSKGAVLALKGGQEAAEVSRMLGI